MRPEIWYMIGGILFGIGLVVAEYKWPWFQRHFVDKPDGTWRDWFHFKRLKLVLYLNGGLLLLALIVSFFLYLWRIE